MSRRQNLELTLEEQREADEYNRRIGAMLGLAKNLNGPGAPSINELFPNAIPVGKLVSAATSGKLWRVKQALNEGADPNEASVQFGTALHAASQKGFLEIVWLLAEQGANVAARDSQGRTPAEAAIAAGHADVAKYLKTRT
jgi:ankyrin repeat protein